MSVNTDLPPFLEYEACPTCQGRGWKRERGGYSLIPCPTCKCARKLPIIKPDGRFMKNTESILEWSDPEIKRWGVCGRAGGV